jgi:hypothetical protein
MEIVSPRRARMAIDEVTSKKVRLTSFSHGAG